MLVSAHERGVPAPHVPDPLHVSAPLHTVESGQAVPGSSKLLAQTPAPLQVSGLSHAVSLALPQAVPAGSTLFVQAPAPLHVSGLWHAVSLASPQAVPRSAMLFWHTPAPLQVSAPLHSVLV